MFAGADDDPNYVPPVNERAGNFRWGEDAAAVDDGGM